MLRCSLLTFLGAEFVGGARHRRAGAGLCELRQPLGLAFIEATMEDLQQQDRGDSTGVTGLQDVRESGEERATPPEIVHHILDPSASWI